MSVKVMIPTPLRPHAGGKAAAEFEVKTVAEALGRLTTEFGDLKRHLFTEDGKLRSFVNVYLNGEDIRYLAQENTPTKDGDTIDIIPSIAGGSSAEKLSNEEIVRYSRHLIMPEVGMEGQLKLRKNPKCPMCGEHRAIHLLINYYEFCGVRGEEALDRGDRFSAQGGV